MKRKCDICDKRRKTIPYKTRILDKITTIDLCKKCDILKRREDRPR